MKQLGDNNPDKYIMALLLETIAEEFPRQTYECDVIIIIIMVPSLIVVCRHEMLMQRSGMWHSCSSWRCGGADLGQAARSYSHNGIADVILFTSVLNYMVGAVGEIL